jgi:serine/threonine protein phosphatase PrpC
MSLVFLTAGAFVVGSGHDKERVPCQDFTYTLHQDKTSVMALADGAGSSSHSSIGAQISCKVSSKWIANHFDEYFYNIDGLADGLNKILLKRLKIAAKENDISIKQLQSTLQIVALKKNRFIVAHVGDGVIGVVKNNNLQVISEPNNGEFVNQTYFIGSKLATQHIRIRKGYLDEIDGFVLMSDGSAESLYNKKEKQISNAVKEMLKWFVDHDIEEVQEAIYNNLQEVISKRTQDDCSLVLACINR